LKSSKSRSKKVSSTRQPQQQQITRWIAEFQKTAATPIAMSIEHKVNQCRGLEQRNRRKQRRNPRTKKDDRELMKENKKAV
jgi:hypothetical protein